MTKEDMRNELDDMLIVVGKLFKRLKVLRYEMHNRAPIQRAPSASARMSPQIKQSILAMHAQFPGMTMSQLAHAHGINSEGRISELLAGKRL